MKTRHEQPQRLCLLALLWAATTSLAWATPSFPQVGLAKDALRPTVSLDWDDAVPRLDEPTIKHRLEVVQALRLRESSLLLDGSSTTVYEISLQVQAAIDGKLLVLRYDHGLFEPVLALSDLRDLLRETDAVLRENAAEAATEEEQRVSLIERRAEHWALIVEDPELLADSENSGAVWIGSSGIGTVGLDHAAESLERLVLQMTEEFLNARLAAKELR